MEPEMKKDMHPSPEDPGMEDRLQEFAAFMAEQDYSDIMELDGLSDHELEMMKMQPENMEEMDAFLKNTFTFDNAEENQ